MIVSRTKRPKVYAKSTRTFLTQPDPIPTANIPKHLRDAARRQMLGKQNRPSGVPATITPIVSHLPDDRPRTILSATAVNASNAMAQDETKAGGFSHNDKPKPKPAPKGYKHVMVNTLNKHTVTLPVEAAKNYGPKNGPIRTYNTKG